VFGVKPGGRALGNALYNVKQPSLRQILANVAYGRNVYISFMRLLYDTHTGDKTEMQATWRLIPWSLHLKQVAYVS
jgi:hypothetical protein